MKKFFIIAFSILMISSAFAMNQRVDTSNFFVNTSNTNVISVIEAKKLNDNAPIVLEGYLVQQIDDDEFIFKDNTDQIRIDIDDQVMMKFANAQITPNTLIRIYGSLDKEIMEETTADVFKLEIIKR